MTRTAHFLTFLAWAALPCQGQAETPVPAAFSAAQWKPVFQGVDHTAITLADPRPLKIQVLRVNLATAGVSLAATPDNGDAPGETSSLRTSNFLKSMKCQAAINAGPFDVVSSLEGKAINVSGLQVAGGKIVSPDNGYPALIYSQQGKVRIQRTPFPEKDIKEAVSGFQVILWNGKVTASDVKLHPRTGAGVSADGKTLWLLVADGRQAGVSEGCTTVEMAAWLQEMGSTSALNLDGGGTTTMVLAKPDGSPQILNRPIHAGIPGMERPAGSHLGIRALPLKAE
jgi:hypothetical protein